MNRVSRRDLLRAGALGGASLTLTPAAARAATTKKATASSGATYDFNQGWRFGGVYGDGSQEPGYPDHRYPLITLPHTVTPLSWGDWNPATWERTWIYRKHFSGAALAGGRVFLDFDGVMTDATVYLNGVEMAQHQGGFLPWSVELTDELLLAQNVLAVVVDGRWLQVPPEGNPGGPGDIDYLVPAGIYRDVRLRLVPEAFISDVFAKPQGVLSSRPGLEVQATVDAAAAPHGRVKLTVELLDGSRKLAEHSVEVSIRRGTTVATLTLGSIRGITLWSPDTPKLYTVRTTISAKSIPSHTLEVTTGFRQATFEVDGFYLNGERLQIFGLNRHQSFPYTGMAASQRLQARDAELIKNVLNCNMVRCSHYPQSPHFLDACDQVGLMVWEEPPGWQYVGDAHFQQLVLQNVRDLVLRDRNRPSVIVWATRLNETSSYYDQLYAEARALAYRFDGTRQTTGAVDTQSTAGWSEDVFAYDDYHTSDGNAILEPPLTGVPYMVSEAVGSLDGPPLYRWIDSSQTLGTQARMHAQVHDIARSNQAYAGLLAFGSIDYDSLSGGDRLWHSLKWGGVLDTFRVPKPGASFYRSQLNPAVSPVIFPAFYWDFGPSSPATGPGDNAMIATNCEVLQIYLNGQLLTSAAPDTASYGSLAYPPVFVDLTVDGTGLPTLRIDGYIAGKLVTSLQMSSNPASDHLRLDLEDSSIQADGSDATRLTFRALDAFGNQRPYVSGDVTLSLKGPAVLIGQNPFDFGGYGGVGGALIRSEAHRTGVVTVTASHPTLGSASANLRVTAQTGKHL
jgi:beta-galactosidase